MFQSTGYYIVEKHLVNEISSNIVVLSIIEFLRRAKKKDVSGLFYVYGLEEVARMWDDAKSFSRYLRESLRYLANTLLMKGGIIVFIVEGKIVGNAKPVVRYGDLEIGLAEIFGADRLEQRESLVYSPPNIP